MANYPLTTWRKHVQLPVLVIKEEGTGYRVTCDEAPEMDLVQPTYGLAEKEGHDYIMNRRHEVNNGKNFELGIVQSADEMARATGMRARMEGDSVPDEDDIFDATAPVAPRKVKK